MWRSLWRSIDRFSLQYFKHIITELQQIKVVDMHNREVVIDLLQSTVELVTYGDRQDPLIFECFMEYQVLAEFVRVLKISRKSRIEAPLLQYLSIMIQNMNSEHSIYYCLSNDYINSIIGHKFEFEGGDLALYYVSFLRALSNKLNKDTLCLLLKVHGDAVVSFPLYYEALKFSHHREKMIQTAIRALTLSIYNVSDDMVYQYITAPPVSKYFSDLVASLKEQFFHLDTLVQATNGMRTNQKREELLLETDDIIDDLYYLKDMLGVGDSRLTRVVMENLLRILVFPILLPLLQLRQINGSNLSVVTSFYTVSRLLQVIGGKGMFDTVAGVILYPHMASSVRDAIVKDSTVSADDGKSIFNQLGDMEKVVSSDPEAEGAEIFCCPQDTIHIHRSGILAHIFSESCSLLLSSLFVLLIIAEAKDLHPMLFRMIGISGMRDILIVNALLKVLASQPPFSVLIQWHTGWFLRKLLISPGKGLASHNFKLFNASYQQSHENFLKELDGCWFDHIPEVLRNEWAGCKAALEESSQCKDPFFLLELDFSHQSTDGDATSYLAWQRMVNTVKVFILHLQLKSCILKGELLEELTLDISAVVDSGKTHASDVASASFGSEVPLGSGIPCRIAFSNAGIRDIYLIPVAKKRSGKLLLAEKHPFRSHRGTVLAIAPLAGSNPKVDEGHPTWLHLQIREFEPKFRNTKFRGYHAAKSNHIVDGRWTLGFSDAKACAAARLSVLEETRKLRSSVESLLAPLLQNNCLENSSESEDD
ncbi:protein TRANSPARENT TESTA 9-like isoform X2 [Argentina anserina]|uniref:protein TRANSPARENT TESTA 9-like isoform X2 n=1 Tax=Argentina anserina TaxID=57926 RepID=UPI0021767771|nr:protein TRANSPARENT TESTA 9-like isoform X2 [Potentilla anserina]